MKEKHKKSKKHKHKKESRDKKRRRDSTSSSSSESDAWVEKETRSVESQQRDDWMAMTGMLKTYTSQDIKPKREEKDKKHIDSYNPGTSVRELNPYWKNGGSGLPQTPEEFRKSRPFVKPSENDDYYKSSSSKSESRYVKPKEDDCYKSTSSKSQSRYVKPEDDDYYTSSSSRLHKSSTDTHDKDKKYERCDRKSERDNGDNERRDRKRERHERDSDRQYDSYSRKSYNWKKDSNPEPSRKESDERDLEIEREVIKEPSSVPEKPKQNLYLSDEKMNKLAAKIVKAEILGDTKTVEELKSRLEAVREYRKQNPNAREEEDESVMLMSTNAAGNSRPLVKHEGDPRSKGGKRKAQTHDGGQREKYFGDDDKHDLATMFQEEKYGNKNYDDEAQLAKITSKHKNPNDDLEDIFMDDISKNRNAAKDAENEKRRAISQHVKMERSLEGCEYCVGSKSMLKHLMVTCGNKVYLAVPAKQSLVQGQCIITTIQHNTCVTALDEDVWEEILNFRKALTQFFNSKNQDVVFYETATRLHRFPHMVINCVPLPRDVGDMAAIYFKKALLECEAEWSMNKKVVDLKGKNIRKGVPKGLPYFWIDFGMDPGFAHIIEDQQLFHKGFAEEIIGGFLDIDHHLWKNPKKEYGDVQRKKVLDFIKEWKPYESLVKQNNADDDDT